MLSLLFLSIATCTLMEPEAFRQSLIELLPRLRRFARSLTSSVTDADDLVQAACERALRRREQFQAGTRMDSWMFRIIHTLRMDEMKSKRLSSPHFSFEEQYDGWEGENVEQDRVEAKIMLNRVLETMDQLPARDRAVLGLVCIEGLSYKEAAETLAIPTGTLMSRLARARLRLMELMGDDGI